MTKGFFRRYFPLLTDVWSFVKSEKKFWLLPVILMLLLVSLFIVVGESALSPFIYALF